MQSVTDYISALPLIYLRSKLSYYIFWCKITSILPNHIFWYKITSIVPNHIFWYLITFPLLNLICWCKINLLNYFFWSNVTSSATLWCNYRIWLCWPNFMYFINDFSKYNAHVKMKAINIKSKSPSANTCCLPRQQSCTGKTKI